MSKDFFVKEFCRLTQWFFPERLLSYIFFLLNFAGISLSHFLKQITQVDF